ncbi:MAG: carbon-nitrogen hydrolase family protein [Lachnospiraceae bacterium]|nr:carbon-nitrogen hydrolase family protein [Lachnospiraceae bacterium]
MSKDIITAAVVNFNAIWGEKYYNARRMADYMEAAKAKGADLVVFPEMALTGYSDDSLNEADEKMQKKDAETLEGECVEFLAKKAEELGIYAAFGMPERDVEDDSRVYNAAVVVGPEGVVGSYRKIHPALEETKWCTKGSEPFSFETPWGKIGVGICYDSYKFHELVRYYTMEGCRMYLNLTALCDVPDYESLYMTTLGQIVNTFDQFVLSSNLCGREAPSQLEGGSLRDFGLDHWPDFPGCSMVLGPGANNRIHVYTGGLGCKEPGMFLHTIDLSLVRRNFHTMNPLVGEADVRPYLYIDTFYKQR